MGVAAAQMFASIVSGVSPEDLLYLLPICIDKVYSPFHLESLHHRRVFFTTENIPHYFQVVNKKNADSAGPTCVSAYTAKYRTHLAPDCSANQRLWVEWWRAHVHPPSGTKS